MNKANIDNSIQMTRTTRMSVGSCSLPVSDESQRSSWGMSGSAECQSPAPSSVHCTGKHHSAGTTWWPTPACATCRQRSVGERGPATSERETARPSKLSYRKLWTLAALSQLVSGPISRRPGLFCPYAFYFLTDTPRTLTPGLSRLSISAYSLTSQRRF